MDQMLKEIAGNSTQILSSFSLIEVIISLLLAFGLSLILSYIYRITHKGISYQQSFVHTLIIITVTISVIMLIIGSNLARAFSLVGALSIIRFRTAIKDPRDIAFTFTAMAIGMACGTRFYYLALIFTIIIGAIIYFLFVFEVGKKQSNENFLELEGKNLQEDVKLKEIFERFLISYDLVSINSASDENQVLLYRVLLKPQKTPAEFIGTIQNQISQVTPRLLMSQQAIL